MPFTLNLGDQAITVKVQRQRRKTLGLKALGHDTLSVRCPQGVSDPLIADALRAHGDKVMGLLKAWQPSVLPPWPSLPPQQLAAWHKTLTTGVVNRAQAWALAMDVNPTKVTVKAMKTCWGSCTPRNAISLNVRLAYCPPGVLDAIIVHELAHLSHHNHGPAFWALVAQFDPQYKDHRGWLRQHAKAIMAMPLGLEMVCF